MPPASEAALHLHDLLVCLHHCEWCPRVPRTCPYVRYAEDASVRGQPDLVPSRVPCGGTVVGGGCIKTVRGVFQKLSQIRFGPIVHTSLESIEHLRSGSPK